MNIQHDIPLDRYTTFRIGGHATHFLRVGSIGGLRDALSWGSSEELPVFVLGSGSNILVSDEGFDGLVIKIEIPGVHYTRVGDRVRVVVGAGESWDDFVEGVVKRGLWGIENLSGIPGTVGAAPIQNIGAYGQEVADTIEWVEAMHKETTDIQQFEPDECDFAYRDSFFKTGAGQEWVVTRVAFELKKNSAPNLSYKDLREYFSSCKVATLTEMREAVLEIRARKFPDLDEVGTAGSFFTNPIVKEEKFKDLQEEYPEMPGYYLDDGRVKIPFAWILDHVFEVKGEYHGSVGFFEKQPLVVVNKGGGTAEDIHSLTEPIQERAKTQLGLEVVPEVTCIGDGW